MQEASTFDNLIVSHPGEDPDLSDIGSKFAKLGRKGSKCCDARRHSQFPHTDKDDGEALQMQMPDVSKLAESSKAKSSSKSVSWKTDLCSHAPCGALHTILDTSTSSDDEGREVSLSRNEVSRKSVSCPCCGTATMHGLSSDSVAIAGVCDNRKWAWNGETPFCCHCAARKGLGRLSHFGCDTCHVRRSKYYKKSGWFNHECKHCHLPRSQHKGHNTLTYPPCPGPEP